MTTEKVYRERRKQLMDVHVLSDTWDEIDVELLHMDFYSGFISAYSDRRTWADHLSAVAEQSM